MTINLAQLLILYQSSIFGLSSRPSDLFQSKAWCTIIHANTSLINLRVNEYYIFMKKLFNNEIQLELSLRSVENWKLVSGKLKKKTRHNLDGSTPEPAIPSGNTGQRILCFDSGQLTTTWMWNIRLQGPKLARKCNISHWFPCGAD